MRLNVGMPDERAPHAEGNFKTPSGKCEFKASAAAGGNFVVPVWRNGYNEMQPGDPVDPVPELHPAGRSPAANAGAGAALSAQPRSRPSRTRSSTRSTRTSRYQQRRQGEQFVVIHPNDAGEPQHQERRLRAGVQRSRRVRGQGRGQRRRVRGTGHGRRSATGRASTAAASSVNATTSSRHCNLGGAGSQSDNLVEIARV